MSKMRSITEKITIYIILSLIVIGCRSTIDNAEDFGISVRSEPLRDFVTNETIRVRDFGAVPDDDKIDTEAIQRAIDSAIKMNSKVLILFESGIYRPDAFDRRHALEINRAEDIIF